MESDAKVLASVLVIVMAGNTARLIVKRKRSELVSYDGVTEPVTGKAIAVSLLFLALLMALCAYEWLHDGSGSMSP